MADKRPVAMEQREDGGDGRRYAPSTARNREPIRDVFAAEGLTTGDVLEVASGTGEHGAFLTDAFPALRVPRTRPGPAHLHLLALLPLLLVAL